jgi:hypothetical protein
MAKGNDGNLLQHGIELAAVSAIASKPLWLTCTHSMAPRESCPEPNRDRRLRHWLNTQFGTPSVAAAYRLTNATLDSYPNTSELIAATFGDENIRGDLFEVCEDKTATYTPAGRKVNLGCMACLGVKGFRESRFRHPIPVGFSQWIR